MEPLTTTLLAALSAGAAAATTAVASQAIQDAYAGLKQLISNTFRAHPAVADAVQQVEDKPASPNRQGVLQEELEAALAADHRYAGGVGPGAQRQGRPDSRGLILGNRAKIRSHQRFP